MQHNDSQIADVLEWSPIWLHPTAIRRGRDRPPWLKKDAKGRFPPAASGTGICLSSPHQCERGRRRSFTTPDQPHLSEVSASSTSYHRLPIRPRWNSNSRAMRLDIAFSVLLPLSCKLGTRFPEELLICAQHADCLAYQTSLPDHTF